MRENEGKFVAILTLNLGFENFSWLQSTRDTLLLCCTPFFAKRVLYAYLDGDEHISSKK